jgi:leukotriene-A4 hydrolase
MSRRTARLQANETDPTTQSNYTEVVTEHVAFDWVIDFEKAAITGSTTHTLLVLAKDLNKVM